MKKPNSHPETDAQRIEEFVRRQAAAAADDYERRLNADASLDHIRLTPEMKEDMMRRIAELEGRADAGTGADAESADAGRFADAASVRAGGFAGAAGTGESAGAMDVPAVGAGGFAGAAGTGESADAMDASAVGADGAAAQRVAASEDALRLLSEEDRRALEVGRETLAKRGRRRRWRVVGIAAAAVVVVLGIGMTSTANRVRLANLWKSLLGEEVIFQLNNDEAQNMSNLQIQNACADILEQIGIRAIQFMYMPDHMMFESYVVDTDITSAYMRYIYQSTAFNVRMIKKSDNTVLGLAFDGEIQDTFIINTTYGEIVAMEIKNEAEEMTYGAELLYDNCQYTISGSIPREEFVKIIENINLF